MARRNRKRKVEAVALPAPFAGLIVFVVVCALAYVWLDCRGEATGRLLKQAEVRQAELKKTLSNEEYKWVQTRSPANIERSLARYGIAMSWPRPDQIVRIRDGNTEQRLLETEAAVASYRRAELSHRP
jgi:hypothetical protein